MRIALFHTYFVLLLAIVATGMVMGCAGEDDIAVNPTPANGVSTPDDNGRAAPVVQPRVNDGNPPRPQGTGLQDRTFEDLLSTPDRNPDPQAFGGAEFGHPQHDDAKLSLAGFRKISGERLNVYTDLPRGDVDDFPRVFDAAITQWKAFFDLPDDKLAKWHMTAYVIKDQQLARRHGLIPDDLPDFSHGYQRAYEMWVYDQPSDYYRRHLLLHEGTHGVMNTLLGGAGPPWYMEGVAELLATHQWNGENLTLRYNPTDTDEVPYWGRVKIVRDDFAADRGMTLDALMNYDNRAHQSVNAYAWCWAACLFLDTHPATQAAFRKMQQHVRLPGEDFNRRFLEAVADQWNRVANEQWFLFVQNLQYGSDPLAAIVQYADGAPLPGDGAVIDVNSQSGWQSSGIAVEAGKSYALRAAGNYTIAAEDDGTPWPCEPGGVTLRYHNSRPLGELLCAIRRGEPTAGVAPDLSQSMPVGLRTMLAPKFTGVLYFQVNDSSAERHDNAGKLQVQIKSK